MVDRFFEVRKEMDEIIGFISDDFTAVDVAKAEKEEKEKAEKAAAEEAKKSQAKGGKQG